MSGDYLAKRANDNIKPKTTMAVVKLKDSPSFPSGLSGALGGKCLDHA